ncbi:MAG: PipX family protein [Gomphosphaeria aponina SAG 52.96 = DSM 107014]|uniref:PipX family protein n=1 Tax=Gomphosphaeria aponina SAG 52.96 = DSM 107014 TaxID=1521640 RepID=A0A941JV13_9CHRO|nr:PipX family protein [Gomphosphaeria aponina SAG 52.96 = DSM 107014]
MDSETYLNHPTFGLLYRVCILEENQELFTTLYAQRLFFIVTITADGINFEPVSRSEGRMQVEKRLRQLRNSGLSVEYKELNHIYKQTFQ